MAKERPLPRLREIQESAMNPPPTRPQAVNRLPQVPTGPPSDCGPLGPPTANPLGIPAAEELSMATMAEEPKSVSAPVVGFSFATRAVLGTAMGLGVVAWFLTIGRPPSPAVLLHYGGLVVAASFAAILWVDYLHKKLAHVSAAQSAIAAIPSALSRPLISLWPVWSGVIAAALAIAIWSCFDFYERSWSSSETGFDYITTFKRWGSVPYHERIYGDGGDGGSAVSAEGPLSPSGKRHGHWTITTYSPYRREDVWYWYGEQISEGDWHLRD